MAFPMPRLPPVTRATRSWSVPITTSTSPFPGPGSQVIPEQADVLRIPVADRLRGPRRDPLLQGKESAGPSIQPEPMLFQPHVHDERGPPPQDDREASKDPSQPARQPRHRQRPPPPGDVPRQPGVQRPRAAADSVEGERGAEQTQVL